MKKQTNKIEKTYELQIGTIILLIKDDGEHMPKFKQLTIEKTKFIKATNPIEAQTKFENFFKEKFPNYNFVEIVKSTKVITKSIKRKQNPKDYRPIEFKKWAETL